MDDLRSAVRGRVLLPGEPGFDPARRPWNPAVEQPVAAVVEAADAEDVAGVASGRLQAAAARHGLTGPPGSSPVVSVTGVALGGGLSWSGRAHGWVADNVTAFDAFGPAAPARLRDIKRRLDPDTTFRSNVPVLG